MQSSYGDGMYVPAFILSLLSGLLLLLSSGIMFVLASSSSSYVGMMGGYYGMMNGYHGMMQNFGFGGWFYGLTLIGIASAGVVISSAVLLYIRPKEVTTWGLLILVFSVVGLAGMGGFFVGAVLGVIGGVLALTNSRSQDKPVVT